MDVKIVPIIHSPYGGADTVADGYTTYRLCNSKYMVIKNTDNCITYLMRYGMSNEEKEHDDHVRFKVEFCYKNTSGPTKTTEASLGKTMPMPTARTTKLVDKFDLLGR
nr:unnamed protein product [Spirometra erinaceieuropaei]